MRQGKYHTTAPATVLWMKLRATVEKWEGERKMKQESGTCGIWNSSEGSRLFNVGTEPVFSAEKMGFLYIQGGKK